MTKQHKHVIRDIEMLAQEAGPNLDPGVFIERRGNGQVANVWVPLELSILLLSRSNGPKAVAARKMILEALRYFIHRAPELERELEDLRERAIKQAPGAKAGTLPIPVTQEGLFGGPVITHYVLMKKEDANDMAVAKGQLRHIQRLIEGLSRRMNKLQSKLDGHC